ncbi:MAG: DUF6483 family protein [Clostridium sp.]|nr:DUF6483 family protein [Clostridium sp.]MCM1172924.1 DUF6483 family protein [Clostridium sp.]MCM1208586.1 DUF6483 family protein [Ruminococcus sp.]
MKLIKEMIRAILKVLFNIDTDNPLEDVIKDEKSQNTLEELLDMVDNGDINEAENQVYDMTSDHNMANLPVALLFYSYLNDKDDEFLQKHDFCRDEIKSGVTELASRYGLMDMVEIFLSET